MSNKSTGWIQKYNIDRVDGTDGFGGKHCGCDLFVLDFTHDPIAMPAALEYAFLAFERGYCLLARDMVRRVQASPNFHPEFISKRHEWAIERADIFDREQATTPPQEGE